MLDTEFLTWFVGGASRSGTTLLAGLLSAVTGGLNVGELHIFWRSLEADRLCTCGVPLRLCPMWQEVAHLALKDHYIKSVSDAARVEARAPRQRTVLARGWRAAVPEETRALRRGTETALRRVSGTRQIVDSSKSAGAAVSAVQRHMRIIHLVRDPRAVAFSMSRPKPDPSLNGRLTPSRGALRSSAVWLVSNLAIQRFALSPIRLIYRVRYEDFVAEPDATLSRLLGSGVSTRRAPLNSGGQHAVAGNPWRFDPGNSLTLDSRWIEQMPKHSRRLVTVATAPLLVTYGYIL